ncbi:MULTISPECIES: hypothetical protein [unclassified Caloramator]|jgi:hypothetical protein|uniref:hypothetical protein n=1 Tax=unclassified Caloramator TaxID=2629145 RepID=UPI00237DAF2A|nr:MULTISPECIES: hypothetical protein [unclassified Caloramator]MDO6355091.1 hypothetical protein [Caloramator sp. CAR-1]WDU82177.1 hypothetical protein PWK10_10620 [Caloramator sp. Dgby_cultured_2]
MSGGPFYPQHPHPWCSIKSILEALKGEKVLIVLKGCCEEWVKVLAVCDNVLIAEFPDKKCYCPIKFIDIDCICEVITDCQKVVKNFLDDKEDHHHKDC